MQAAFVFSFVITTLMVANCQEFSTRPHNTTTFQLHGTQFICEVIVSGGVLKWKLPNGQLIDNSLNSNKWFVSATYQGNKIYSRLDIKYCETSDTGRYECVWRSDDEEVISVAYLNILVPATTEPHVCAASSTLVRENDLVTITCAKLIEGNDHRNENEGTLWWEGASSLEDTSRYFIRVDNWNSRLWYNIGFSFYASPSYNDVQLTCEAVFSDGMSHDCVVGPFNILYIPIVRVTMTPSTVRDGDEVSLTCESNANPFASQHEWYINGYLVDETEGYIVQGKRLYIPNVDKTKHDLLIIGCFAINSLGRGKNSVRLLVENSLKYVGPMVSGILVGIILIAGLILYLSTRNKKSLRVFLRTCARASFKWQNEYTVKPDDDQNELFVMNNYRRRSRRMPSIVLQKYHRPSDRDSDEARSTSITSGRETTLSISSTDSKELYSATEASTSGIYLSERTPSTRSGLLSNSSSTSPVSYEENASLVYDEMVIKQADIYIIGEKGKVKNKKSSGGQSTVLRGPKMKNTDSKSKQGSNKYVLDFKETGNTSDKSLDRWSVKDITFEELDERVSVTTSERIADDNIDGPVSSRYNKSKTAKTGRRPPVRDTTQTIHHDSTRALWNNAGFVPISSKASNSGKIRPHGIYVKKHQKAIGSLYNQLNVKNVKQKRSYIVNVVNNKESVPPANRYQNDATQF